MRPPNEMAVDGTSDDLAECDAGVVVGSPQWLVSLRNLRELSIASQFPIDILDLKEPRHGALAPTSRQIWSDAARFVAELRKSDRGTPKLSAALGEPHIALPIAGGLPSEFDFAKAGPSGCETIDHLRCFWDDVRSRLPPSVEFVAVAYADHESAKSADTQSIFKAAKASGIRRCLIDTFTKDGRSTLDHLSIESLSELSRFASGAGLWWALAGSIRSEDIMAMRATSITPNCFGTRGDVCDEGRAGELSSEKLLRWSMALGRKC